MPLIYKTEETKAYRTIGFKCDKCGKEFSHEIDHFEMDEMFCYSDIGGYSSPWGDGTNYEVVMCQKCFYELMKPYATIEK